VAAQGGGVTKPKPKVERTSDPDVVIEARGLNMVRYRNTAGRRWEVWGACDRRGACMLGAVLPGFGEVRTYEDLDRAIAQLGPDLGGAFDRPVLPSFEGCCPFAYVELEPAR
jgi:hypothetical protein